jgi:hypothetical protein
MGFSAVRRSTRHSAMADAAHRRCQADRGAKNIGRGKVAAQASGGRPGRADSHPQRVNAIRRASRRFPAQNLRAGCAYKIARYLSRKSTSWNLYRAAACTLEPGKRAGSSPCRRSFNRTNCFRPLLPGRSIACRAPANPTHRDANPPDRAGHQRTSVAFCFLSCPRQLSWKRPRF